MKDWQTTLAGVATIVATLCNAGLSLYHQQPLNFSVMTAGLTAGIGLIRAADTKLTPEPAASANRQRAATPAAAVVLVAPAPPVAPPVTE
jgi:hypothetical protein